MYEIINKGIDDGHKLITYSDKKTGVEMTYFEQEIKNISDKELREFLEREI